MSHNKQLNFITESSFCSLIFCSQPRNKISFNLLCIFTFLSLILFAGISKSSFCHMFLYRKLNGITYTPLFTKILASIGYFQRIANRGRHGIESVFRQLFSPKYRIFRFLVPIPVPDPAKFEFESRSRIL